LVVGRTPARSGILCIGHTFCGLGCMAVIIDTSSAFEIRESFVFSPTCLRRRQRRDVERRDVVS
jgi:hypothetical protein